MKKNNIGLATNSWGADWNDGFGFLSQIVDGRVIRETGGSSNLSVRIPEVSTQLDTAVAETDKGKREQMCGDIDKRVMEEAVIYPALYAKSLMLRGQEPDERLLQRRVWHVRLPVDGSAVVTDPFHRHQPIGR